MASCAVSISDPRALLSEILRTSTCPACGYHVAVPFYDGGHQPLTTLAWPRSAAEAQALRRLPLTFVQCVDCGHVYNAEFDYTVVPYSEKPNLMFNGGELWGDYLGLVRGRILERLPERPTVVEIGCGDGHLLRALCQARPGGRYVGFDPNAGIQIGRLPIEARQTLFDPTEHLLEYRPDLLISRHVLEHLMNPLAFLQSLAFAVSWAGVETRLFFEVPCIERACATGRTADFFYEHNSHFTSTSLRRMLTRCASQVELVERGYDDEVVFGFAYFGVRAEQVKFAREGLNFWWRAQQDRATVGEALNELSESGKSTAIWGGTGKAAAFINHYGLDAARFPLVVDSDPEKVGTFVPGTGQGIRFRDYLLEHPVQVILIATHWRARDIVQEIQRYGIPFEKILIEYQGHLVDYFTSPHPYVELQRECSEATKPTPEPVNSPLTG